MSEGRDASPSLPRGLRIANVLVISRFALPMSIDDCAHQTCGDEKWIGYAQWVLLGSMAPAGLFSGLGLIQLARNRVGSWLPLTG